MTHKSESTFSDRVEQFLIDEYGKHNVYGQKYLSERVRWVDFYVEGPLTDFAIEVENDFEACFKGVSQSVVYASELECTPLVIIPPGHREEPEASDLDSIVKIVELDV